MLAKLNRTLKEQNILLKQVNFALELLIRIRKIYPYIFAECITEEEVDKLVEKGN